MQSLAALPTPLAGAAPAPTSLLAVSTPPRIFCATPVYPRRKTKPSSIHIFFRTAVMHLAVSSGSGRGGHGGAARLVAPKLGAISGGVWCHPCPTVHGRVYLALHSSGRLVGAAGEQSRARRATSQPKLPSQHRPAPAACRLAPAQLALPARLLPALPQRNRLWITAVPQVAGREERRTGQKEAGLSGPCSQPSGALLRPHC
jgi:hypothetical protein